MWNSNWDRDAVENKSVKLASSWDRDAVKKWNSEKILWMYLNCIGGQDCNTDENRN